MSHERFDPSKYESIAEMPEEQKKNFETVPSVPGEPEQFVRKSVFETQKRLERDAEDINELRSDVKKLFGRGKIDSDDMMREEAIVEDSKRSVSRLSDPSLLKESVRDEMNNRYWRLAENQSESRWEKIKSGFKSGFAKWLSGEGGSSSRSSFLPSNEDVAEALERAKKRNPFL